MNKNNLRNRFDLYLPSNTKDINAAVIDDYIKGQEAINSFLDCQLTPNELVEFLGDVTRVNINDWLDCVNHNLNVG